MFMKDVDFLSDLKWIGDKHNQKVLKYRLEQLYGKTN